LITQSQFSYFDDFSPALFFFNHFPNAEWRRQFLTIQLNKKSRLERWRRWRSVVKCGRLIEGTLMPSWTRKACLRVFQFERRLNPANFVVSNTSDAGPGSLRQAIADANTTPGPDSVSFDPTFFSLPRTILLKSGELLVSESLTISGPVKSLIVDAGKASRVMTVDVPGLSAQVVSISDLTFANGSAGAGNGGGVLNVDEALILNRVAVNACTTSQRGGGIAVGQSSGSLALSDCTLSGNSAAVRGGAVYVKDASAVSIVRSTLANNSSGSSGGAVYFQSGGTCEVFDSTFFGNVAGGGGGAMQFAFTATTLRNCTVVQNTANYGGGVSVLGVLTSFVSENCTVALNKASSGAGGIETVSTIVLESVIVANNSGPTANDVAGAANSSHSLIGNTSGATITGSNNILNVNPQLDVLADNGGPTMTCLLLPGSPAVDAGANPAGLSFDQRGPGFPRVLGGAADIGAAEGVRAAPAAAASAPDVPGAGGTAHAVTVTYAANVAIDVATLGTGDIAVTGPGGFSVTPAFVGVDTNSNGTPRVATYTFTPPGGAWDYTDAGSYTIHMAADEVADTGGLFVPAGAVGGFAVTIIPPPLVFTVTNTNDAGAGSLRQAVLDANAHLATGPDTISFAPGVGGTITLTADLIVLDGVEVQGPGAAKLALTRTKGGHILRTSADYFAPVSVNLTISGLTLRDANASGGVARSGAAILSKGALVLRDCVVSGNGDPFEPSPYLGGGAIYHAGAATFERCTFSGNVVRGSGGAAYVAVGPTVIRGCTFVNNRLSAIGPQLGGALVVEGVATVEDSTFRNNGTSALHGRGGAIGVEAGGVLTLRNCTLANNAANSGGALAVYGTAVIENSTITNNQALISGTHYGVGGGIFSNAQALQLVSSIVSGNLDETAPDIAYATVTAAHSAIGSLAGVLGYTDAGGNLPAGADLKLGPLADNGGPTETVALLAGSPCINAGSNPAGLNYDQRGPGFNRVIGQAADIGAYEYQALPPVVAKVVINNGDVQRSRVTSVRMDFDRVVSVPADAFGLKRNGDGAVVTLAASAVIDSATRVTLTFTGGAVEFGSLADGRYTLTAFAALLGLDGNGDGVAGDDFTTTLHRLFGDADGDGDVDAQDFGAFRAAFGGTNNTFDFDNDGDVDAADFGQFRARFGTVV
jgi:predicted outer membrane repeat protein